VSTWLCLHVHRGHIRIRFVGPLRFLWCDTCVRDLVTQAFANSDSLLRADRADSPSVAVGPEQGAALAT